MPAISKPVGFVKTKKDKPFERNSMATTAFKTDSKGKTTSNPDRETTKDAENALPTHPIKPPGRWSITVSSITPCGDYERFMPGKVYNVDETTKKFLDDKKAVLTSVAA